MEANGHEGRLPGSARAWGEWGARAALAPRGAFNARRQGAFLWVDPALSFRDQGRERRGATHPAGGLRPAITAPWRRHGRRARSVRRAQASARALPAVRGSGPGGGELNTGEQRERGWERRRALKFAGVLDAPGEAQADRLRISLGIRRAMPLHAGDCAFDLRQSFLVFLLVDADSQFPFPEDEDHVVQAELN